ncbi:hypothetical protein D3C71_1833360 [compost metagenome]
MDFITGFQSFCFPFGQLEIGYTISGIGQHHFLMLLIWTDPEQQVDDLIFSRLRLQVHNFVIH